MIRPSRSRRGRRLIVSASTLFTLLSATAVVQSASPPASAVVTSQPVHYGPLQFRPRSGFARWWQSIGWGVLLLVILLASVSAIVLFSRRFKKYLWPESREPTPSDDVWAMHKLRDSVDPDRETDENENTDTPPDAN